MRLAWIPIRSLSPHYTGAIKFFHCSFFVLLLFTFVNFPTLHDCHRKADIKPEMKPPRCDNYYNSAPATATSSDNATATSQSLVPPPQSSPSVTVTPNKRPITGTLNGTLLSSNTSLPSLVDGLPPSGRKTYNTRSAARAAAPHSDEPRPSLDSDRDRDRDFDSNTSQSDSEEEGNLLVEAATEADKVLACVRSRGKAICFCLSKAVGFSMLTRYFDQPSSAFFVYLR